MFSLIYAKHFHSRKCIWKCRLWNGVHWSRSQCVDNHTRTWYMDHLSYFMFHGDVIKWKYFPRYWPFVRGIHRSPANSPHKGQWRGALMFSLICTRINGWINNGEAGDLRRYRAHYDVTVMFHFLLESSSAIYVDCNFFHPNLLALPFPTNAILILFN